MPVEVPNQGPTAVRPASPEEVGFLRSAPDPARMAAIKETEIRSARAATAAPRHWAPVQVDEAQLR